MGVEHKENGSRFSGLAKVQDEADGVHATLLEDLVYTTRDGWHIVVPAGFVTDYASIPRVLSWLIPPRGKYNRPAIIHDFLYQTAPVDPVRLVCINGQTQTARTATNIRTSRCTQSRADYILREACENVDDRFTQRWTIYLGLRAGGWVAWNSYRRAEADHSIQ